MATEAKTGAPQEHDAVFNSRTHLDSASAVLATGKGPLSIAKARKALRTVQKVKEAHPRARLPERKKAATLRALHRKTTTTKRLLATTGPSC